MRIETREFTAFDDQRPGTSGLRKKTRSFMREHYLESFVQGIFASIDGVAGRTLVLGGDGRFHNRVAVQTILKMAAAQKAARVIVGRDGLLSTPAASHLIRQRATDGGIILSASHNPGGIDGDFGIKFNMAHGGPAPEAKTARIFEENRRLSAYDIAVAGDVPLDALGEYQLGEMVVEIVDPVESYAALMENLFDFHAIRDLFARGFRMRFDSMHAVTGPYAVEILERRLGAAEGTVINRTPLEDFGGRHPDPNPHWAKALMDEMFAAEAPDFGAASDGDGDRNMVVGAHCYVNPSDSLAILAANAHHAPGYAGGIKGVARSMPTSSAVDRVAAQLGVPHHATPTGWKFFGNLLDAGQVTICGEESFGTGSDHIREKDGLWAVLLWLNILAVTRKSVAELLRAHWSRYGRNYYSRHDYEEIDKLRAETMMDNLRDQLGTLSGRSFAGKTVARAEEFCYTDPVDGSVAERQGIIVTFDDESRIMLRLSGTGTAGATLRVYLERYESSSEEHHHDPQDALAGVAAAAEQLAKISEVTGKDTPDVVT